MKNKFAIIGLGQFGMTIAKTLSKKGAEVIAIDKDIDKVEHIKEYVSYAISLDATDKQARGMKYQNLFQLSLLELIHHSLQKLQYLIQHQLL